MSRELLTTYTEVDPHNRLTVGSYGVYSVGILRNESVYLYYDYGTDYLDNFNINFDLLCDTSSTLNGRGGIAITNTVGSLESFATTDISVMIIRGSSTTANISLIRGNTVTSTSYTGFVNNVYFCTLSRLKLGNIVTLKIYSDSARTTLLTTLTLTGYITTKYRYLYGFINHNASSAESFTGNIQNLERVLPVIQTTENLSLYTAVNPNSHLTVYGDEAYASGVLRNEGVYLYYDYGVNYFDVINIKFELYCDTTSTANGLGGMAITNTVGSLNQLATTDIVSYIIRGASTTATIYLARGNNVVTTTYAGVVNTAYYCTLTRPSITNTCTLKIYSNSTRTTLLSTLTLTGYSTTKYRYLYGFINNNVGSTESFTGYVQNLDRSNSTFSLKVAHRIYFDTSAYPVTVDHIVPFDFTIHILQDNTPPFDYCVPIIQNTIIPLDFAINIIQNVVFPFEYNITLPCDYVIPFDFSLAAICDYTFPFDWVNPVWQILSDHIIPLDWVVLTTITTDCDIPFDWLVLTGVTSDFEIPFEWNITILNDFIYPLDFTINLLKDCIVPYEWIISVIINDHSFPLGWVIPIINDFTYIYEWVINLRNDFQTPFDYVIQLSSPYLDSVTLRFWANGIPVLPSACYGSLHFWKDGIPYMPTGTGRIPYDFISPVINSDHIFPFEWLIFASITTDIISPFDYYFGIYYDIIIPTEYAITLTCDSVVPFTYIMPIIKDAFIPFDFTQPVIVIASDFVIPFDYYLGIYADIISPFTFTKLFDGDSIIAYEWLHYIYVNSDQTILFDWMSFTSAYSDFEIPIDYYLGIYYDSVFPYSYTKLFSKDTIMPMDWAHYVYVNSDQIIPFEWTSLVTTISDHDILFDYYLRMGQNSVYPFDYVKILNRDAVIPYAWLHSIYVDSDQIIPIDWMSFISLYSDLELPFDYYFGIRQDFIIPVEFTKLFSGDLVIPFEWLHYISVISDLVLPFDWMSFASTYSDFEFIYEYYLGIYSDHVIPNEFLETFIRDITLFEDWIHLVTVISDLELPFDWMSFTTSYSDFEFIYEYYLGIYSDQVSPNEYLKTFIRDVIIFEDWLHTITITSDKDFPIDWRAFISVYTDITTPLEWIIRLHNNFIVPFNYLKRLNIDKTTPFAWMHFVSATSDHVVPYEWLALTSVISTHIVPFDYSINKIPIVLAYEVIPYRQSTTQFVSSTVRALKCIKSAQMTSNWITLSTTAKNLRIIKNGNSIDNTLCIGNNLSPYYVAYYMSQLLKSNNIECEFINNAFVLRTDDVSDSLSIGTASSNNAASALGFSSSTTQNGSFGVNTYDGLVSVVGIYSGLENDTYWIKVSGNNILSVTPNIDNFYKGEVIYSGNFNFSDNVTYTITFDTANGNSANNGKDKIPKFSVSSSDTDSIPTNMELLSYDTWYEIGNKGVRVKFTDYPFGNGDSFQIICVPPETADGTNIEADANDALFIATSHNGAGLIPTHLTYVSDPYTPYYKLVLPKGLELHLEDGMFHAGDTFMVKAYADNFYEISELFMGLIERGETIESYGIRMVAKEGIYKMDWCKIGISDAGDFTDFGYGKTEYQVGTLGAKNPKNTNEVLITNDPILSPYQMYYYLNYWEPGYYLDIGCGNPVYATDPWYIIVEAGSLESLQNVLATLTVYYNYK